MAFIGLGRMGLPMARRLAAAGYRVRGHDLSEQARAEVAAIAGARAVGSAQDAAAGADAVVLMLPSSSAVAAVLLEDGLLEALERGRRADRHELLGAARDARAGAARGRGAASSSSTHRCRAACAAPSRAR